MGEHNFSWGCTNYWRCSDYEGLDDVEGKNITSDEYDKISTQCSEYTRPQRENYNGRRKQFRYIATCSGHRGKNEENLPTQPQQIFDNGVIVTANTINTLRDMIDSEIDDRRKHIYYNGNNSISSEVDDLSSNTILTNDISIGELITQQSPNEMRTVLSGLLEVCKTIEAEKLTNDYQSLGESIKNMVNINRGDVIKHEDGENIQTTINSAVKDCICYSDCNNFGVCNCYGYCNCNY